MRRREARGERREARGERREARVGPVRGASKMCCGPVRGAVLPGRNYERSEASNCTRDARTIARTAGQETRTSAPSMAFNQPGESPGLGNVTAQYPKVVTA